MKELNWIEAAQAIEGGDSIQILDGNLWVDTVTYTVHAHRRYRIKPREFTQGWYEYADCNMRAWCIYRDLSGKWHSLATLLDDVDESKVGKKIK